MVLTIARWPQETLERQIILRNITLLRTLLRSTVALFLRVVVAVIAAAVVALAAAATG